MPSMLGIGVSGLLAYQRSLQTVSHNVANANTEGYSRQRVELGTQTPSFQGVGYVGTGVRMQSVERVYDGFLANQVRTYTSSASHADIFETHANFVDEMLADPEVGMSPAINGFFAELQDVANDPSAVPARQSMFTHAETMIDRFSYLNQRMEDIRGQVNQQMDNVVAEVNGLAASIAEFNKNISLAPGNNPANDLLDQRDVMLNKLAEKISITTVEQDNGAINVFFGKGQLLVVNFDSNQLKVERNEFDVRELQVSLERGAGNWDDVSNQISGGHLGSLFDFREQVLNNTQNSLGVLSIGMADSFNAQHKLGQDLNGELGKDFFNVPGLEVLSSSGNDVSAPFSAQVASSMTDSGKLTGDEYVLSYSSATGYSIKNQSNGLIENIGAALNYDPSSGLPAAGFQDYGFSLSLAGGAPQDGDKFLIRPGRRGSQDLSLNITTPAEIAAAAPVRTSANILSNTGNGIISPGVVTDTGNFQASPLPPLSSDIVMQYDGANINVVSGPAPWNGLSFAYNDSAEVTALPGLKFTISGTLAVGDEFTIESNTNGVGDNRNALLLSGLQNQTLMTNGTASYIDYYGGVVADVGIITNQAQLTNGAQTNLLTQAVDARDSLSGVNLDEEAANLIKFQQAYQAASQVIVASNEMFQSLLSALRR